MHRKVTALLALVAACLASDSHSAPSADSGMAGWSLRTASVAAAACSVELPRLPLRETVTVLVQHPTDLQRPVLRCGTPVAVPLAADAMLLERVEGTEPTLSWTPHLMPLFRGGAALSVEVDVLPLRPEAAGPADPSIPQPVAIAPAVRHYDPPRFRADPTRPGASEPDATPSLAETVPPSIAARAISSIDSDGLFITQGGAWFAVDLAIERGRLQWYRVSAAEVFGLPGRVVIAPTPKHPRALLELLVVDPQSVAVTSLGRPSARGGSWRQELSDIRERGAAMEALLIGRDASPRGDIDGPAFGALLHLGASGWEQVATIPVPSGVAPRALRFDESDPRVLVLTASGATWTRRLP